jgi:Predicted aminoglycoside phosphotransferase
MMYIHGAMWYNNENKNGVTEMRTEFLNIAIHDDGELESILRGKIAAREKLHHWPLSYVEKVTMADGRTLVYKSQNADSSVEREFYAREKVKESPFITEIIYAETLEGCDVMIMPYLENPPLDVTDISGEEFDKIISDVSAQIQTLGDIPVYFDISTHGKLSALTDSVCDIFLPDDVAVLMKWVAEKARGCYENQTIGNVHGDLSASNILTKDGKMRTIIDWQRPMKAPVMLENAIARLLLKSNGDAKRAAAEQNEFDKLAILVHFIWYSHAYKTCLPLNGVIAQAKRLLAEIAAAV